MPRTTNRGVELFYERSEGEGGLADASSGRDGDGDAVAFVPTIGYGVWQWSWQYPAVPGHLDTVVPDLRGTGRSAAPAGPLDVAALADDLEAVLADAGVRRAHLVAQGLGGHVALEYAARYGRARSLVLFGSTPGLPEGTPPTDVVERCYADRDDGAALRETLEPVLSAEFHDRHPDVVEGITEWRAEEDADRDAWIAQAPAFEAWERDWPLYEVTDPVLVCHGTGDDLVPVENAVVLGEVLPNATVERFDGAGHLVGVERSRPVNDRLVGFLESL